MRKRVLLPVILGLLCFPLTGLHTEKARAAVSPLAGETAGTADNAAVKDEGIQIARGGGRGGGGRGGGRGGGANRGGGGHKNVNRGGNRNNNANRNTNRNRNTNTNRNRNTNIAAFILTDTLVEAALRLKLIQLKPLLAPSARPAAAAAVVTALKRRDSGLAEAVCLLITVIATWFTLWNLSSAAQSAWAVNTQDGARTLPPAPRYLCG